MKAFTEHPAFIEFEDGILNHDTDHWLFRFPNGYGASVIRGGVALGSGTAPFELAVIQFNYDDDYQMCYNTSIAHDVLGYLTKTRVLDLLDQIQQLPDRIDFNGNLISTSVPKNVQLEFNF